PSREVRLTAQRALVRGRRDDAVDKLVEALNRSTVNPPPASTLQRFNASTKSFTQCHALWALDALDRNRRTDEPGIASRESLRLFASTTNVALARQAIRQLGLRRERAAVPALLRALKHDIELSL